MLSKSLVFSNAKNKKISKIQDKFVNMPTKSHFYMYKINKKTGGALWASPVSYHICLCTLLYSS